eukprot:6741909-Alexandrium_andersonii.AAC.1
MPLAAALRAPEQLDLGFRPIHASRPPPRAAQPYPPAPAGGVPSQPDGYFESPWPEKLQDHFQAWLTGADRFRKE